MRTESRLFVLESATAFSNNCLASCDISTEFGDLSFSLLCLKLMLEAVGGTRYQRVMMMELTQNLYVTALSFPSYESIPSGKADKNL